MTTDEPTRRMVQPDEPTRRWALGNIPLGRVESARTAEVIEVIHTTGLGIEGSPFRRVTEWFLADGTRIGSTDQ